MAHNPCAVSHIGPHGEAGNACYLKLKTICRFRALSMSIGFDAPSAIRGERGGV